MSKIGVSVLFCFFALSSFAQLGVRFGVMNTNHDVWERMNAIGVASFHTLNVSVDYRKRIKEKRIEFYPTLGIARSNKAIFYDDLGTDYSIQYANVTFTINTHIYILDLEGDCDCPTWGKEGGFLKKGLFIHVGPELGMRSGKGQFISTGQDERNLSFLYGISGGMGLDIGLTEKITLTSLYRLGYYGSTGLPEPIESISGKGKDKTIFHGPELRLGIEF